MQADGSEDGQLRAAFDASPCWQSARVRLSMQLSPYYIGPRLAAGVYFGLNAMLLT